MLTTYPDSSREGRTRPLKTLMRESSSTWIRGPGSRRLDFQLSLADPSTAF